VQGVPALIHISELSWNRIVDPTTVVAVGQELEAKVCRLDRFMQRINLSLKQMQVRLRYIHTIAYELMYTVHFFIQIERGL
jgi:ribosomal protein S1